MVIVAVTDDDDDDDDGDAGGGRWCPRLGRSWAQVGGRTY
jgi:hypothetical protein